MTNSYTWDAEKNKKLLAERGFWFEKIVAEIEQNGVLDDLDNPSPSYPHQRILFVGLNNYAVAVPYVIDGNIKFLKTAFFSRRATKLYLKP